MKTKMQKKVYKITYGSTPIEKDARKKLIPNSDMSNIDSVKVVGTDVYDALTKAEKYTLAIEKRYLQEDDEQVFVESVELVTWIDDLE